jgi:hypothetical protein
MSILTKQTSMFHTQYPRTVTLNIFSGCDTANIIIFRPSCPHAMHCVACRSLVAGLVGASILLGEDCLYIVTVWRPSKSI